MHTYVYLGKYVRVSRMVRFLWTRTGKSKSRVLHLRRKLLISEMRRHFAISVFSMRAVRGLNVIPIRHSKCVWQLQKWGFRLPSPTSRTCSLKVAARPKTTRALFTFGPWRQTKTTRTQCTISVSYIERASGLLWTS